MKCGGQKDLIFCVCWFYVVEFPVDPHKDIVVQLGMLNYNRWSSRQTYYVRPSVECRS
jgi:hypothetical protein